MNGIVNFLLEFFGQLLINDCICCIYVNSHKNSNFKFRNKTKKASIFHIFGKMKNLLIKRNYLLIFFYFL